MKICGTVTHTFEGIFSEGGHKLAICTNLSSNDLRVTAAVLSDASKFFSAVEFKDCAIPK